MARTVDPQRSEQRRTAITLAAARLFAQQGFESTTAAQIASAAGISSGSVFYYFADKRAVLRSVFERDIPGSRELVRRCADDPDPMSAILTMVDEIAAEALDPLASRILVELLRQVDKDPELERIVAENATIVLDGFTAFIERGIDAGSIDTGLDPREAAGWIQNIIDGAFLSADPERDPRPMLRRIVSRFLAPSHLFLAPSHARGEDPV